MEAPAVLESQDVRLRPPQENDIEALFAFGRPPEIAEMFGVGLSDVRPLTREGAEEWFRNLSEHPHAWAIERGGSLIGEIRLDRVNWVDRRAFMAIGLFDPAVFGQGIGSRAIALLLDHAFTTLKLHRISIRVLAYNHRAIRAYEKCGFRVEGRERETAFVNGAWHDDIMMGLLDREFLRLERLTNQNTR